MLSFAEQTPRNARCRPSRAHTGKFRPGAAEVESFIATEHQRRERSSEPERIPPVVRAGEPVVPREPDVPRGIASAHPKLDVRLEIRAAQPHECVPNVLRTKRTLGPRAKREA